MKDERPAMLDDRAQRHALDAGAGHRAGVRHAEQDEQDLPPVKGPAPFYPHRPLPIVLMAQLAFVGYWRDRRWDKRGGMLRARRARHER